MSALKTRSNSLAGLTLDAVLSGEIAPPPPPPPPPLPEPKTLVTHRSPRTLLDIIREEQKEGRKDKNTWKTFREKLRLKRAGTAWASSYSIPASEFAIPETKHKNRQFSHRGSFRSYSGGVDNEPVLLSDLLSTVPMSDPPAFSGSAMFTRGSSMRVGSTKSLEDHADVSMPGDYVPSGSFKPQMSRHDSIRDHGDGQEQSNHRQPAVKFVEERALSAREAVAAQEAAEAAAGADNDDDDDYSRGESGETEEGGAAETKPAMTMSLMDLLEETDRQMGLTGSRYAMEDEDEFEDDEYLEDEEDVEEEGEFSCCMCSVKITGATSPPCGHTFCKLCSKELMMVQKGPCPVCTSFIVEFLDIF